MPASRTNARESSQPLLSIDKEVSGNGKQRAPSYGATRLDSLHHQAFEQNSHLLIDTLYPEDAFEGETYWADIDPEIRTQWERQQYRAEANREFGLVRSAFKQSSLAPLKTYLSAYCLPGVGFFTEGYVLFSVGNIMPLFKSLWPQCWKNHVTCDGQMIKAIKYMEILGIIFGQVTVGYIGDSIGRRWGLIQDALLMLIGALLLTSMWGITLSGWTIMYGVSIFIFSFGVGGEYPMTSTTSMEQHQGRADRLHRGRSVLLAFLMQGWGQLANQLALMILMALFNGTMVPPYGYFPTQATFRIAFFISALCLVYFLYLRIRYVKPPQASNSKSERDTATFKLLIKHYWPRILASSVCWFCSDFPFYGNQVFRNQLLELVTGVPPERVETLWLYNLINIACELTGYYLAALLIDHKAYGRRRMQLVGFAALFILFTIAAGGFPVLNQRGTGAQILQAIYFLSNFWIQFGPNSTTFLIAGEIFPKSVRATAHGFSAAVGKSGALAATVMYNYVEDRTKFTLVALATLVGFVLTVVFVPDTTGLDLAESQRYWAAVVDGRAANYHGVAIHPQHLSWYERVVLKRSDHYDIERDRMARIAELRDEYARVKKSGDWQVVAEDGEGYIDEDVRKYFAIESGNLSA